MGQKRLWSLGRKGKFSVVPSKRAKNLLSSVPDLQDRAVEANVSINKHKHNNINKWHKTA